MQGSLTIFGYTASHISVVIGAIILTGLNAMADQRLIDDFRNDPQGQWRFLADTVMGGVSTGRVVFKNENGAAYVHMTGRVSTENNGGFIQVRRQLSSRPSSATKGIRLIARGNGQRYFIHLRTSGTVLPWQYYQAEFNVTGTWQEYRLPLSAFKRSGRMLAATPSPASVRSVAIVAYGRDHTADIQVREIGFY